jgi:hypothetical protein
VKKPGNKPSENQVMHLVKASILVFFLASQETWEMTVPDAAGRLAAGSQHV